MKNILACLFFTFLFSSILNAQVLDERAMDHNKSDWSFGIGLNIVDDSNNGINELFNAKKNWNFGDPITLNAEYYFNNTFSVATVLSVNSFKEGKTIGGGIILKDTKATYLGIDLAGKYSFRRLFKTKNFEPYISLGFGHTTIGDHKILVEQSEVLVPSNGGITFNTGIGA